MMVKELNLINTRLIESFKPCNDRFDNWVEEYNDFNGTLEEFLSLNKITFEDKIWVGVRLLSRENKIEFACQCAELVLSIYAKYNPDISVLTNAIEKARICKTSLSPKDLDAARFAANVVSRTVTIAAGYTSNTVVYAIANTANAAYCVVAEIYAVDVGRAAYLANPNNKQEIINILLNLSK